MLLNLFNFKSWIKINLVISICYLTFQQLLPIMGSWNYWLQKRFQKSLRLRPASQRNGRQGKIPAKKVGKFWRFPDNSIDEWIQKGLSGDQHQRDINLEINRIIGKGGWLWAGRRVIKPLKGWSDRGILWIGILRLGVCRKTPKNVVDSGPCSLKTEESW